MLVVGGGLYLSFRPQTLLLFHIAGSAGLTETIGQWRELWSGISLPEWVVYSLPGALWVAAYVLLTDLLQADSSREKRLLWTGLIPVIGVGSEVLQATGWLPGTADAADAAAYVLPYLLYLISKHQQRIQRTIDNAVDR